MLSMVKLSLVYMHVSAACEPYASGRTLLAVSRQRTIFMERLAISMASSPGMLISARAAASAYGPPEPIAGETDRQDG
jgi:hypothetical protein